MTKRNPIVEQMPYAVTEIVSGAHMIVARFRVEADANTFRSRKEGDEKDRSWGVVKQFYNERDRLMMIDMDKQGAA